MALNSFEAQENFRHSHRFECPSCGMFGDGDEMAEGGDGRMYHSDHLPEPEAGKKSSVIKLVSRKKTSPLSSDAREAA